MKSNSELLEQLQEKDELAQRLSGQIAAMAEATRDYERLKIEVEESRRELARLREVAVRHHHHQEDEAEEQEDEGADHSKLTDIQLIMKLQRQLDGERLNVMTLKQQLEIERQYTARLSERQAAAQLGSVAAAAAAAAAAGAAVSSPRPMLSQMSQPSSVPQSAALTSGPANLRGVVGGGLLGLGVRNSLGVGGAGGGGGGLGQLTSSSDSLGLQGLLKNSLQLPNSVGGGGLGAINPPGLLRSAPTIRPSPLSALGFPSTIAAPPPPSRLNPVLSAATGGSSSPPSPSAAQSRRLRLLDDLRLEVPDATETELDRHLNLLRAHHGSLSGLATSTVLGMIKDAIAREKQQQQQQHK